MLRETEEDRIAEKVISTHLSRYFDGSTTEKMGMNYGLDFVVINGKEKDGALKVAMFTEAKDRDWTFGDGDGLRLSLWKAMKATLISATTGMRCLLAIRFKDGSIWWTDISWRDGRVIWCGRQDRKGMANDIEPHVIFPWGVWTEVPKG